MRVPIHIVEARRTRLASLLGQHAYLPIQEVCRRLRISEATARRDLSALAGRGMVVRTFGGAMAEFDESFRTFGERLRAAATGKRRIGDRAAELVKPGTTIYLDGGTTILSVAEALVAQRPRGVTVVTNNLPVADKLGGCEGFEVIVPGGHYHHRLAQLGGPRAAEALGLLRFDLAIMSGEAMQPQGIFNPHSQIVAVQQVALSRSAERAFCLDRTKVGAQAPALVVEWSDVGRLITDASIDELESLSPAARDALLPARRVGSTE